MPCELPQDALLRRYSLDGSYADCYVATTVEARSADQLLLADVSGRTKSWLMSVPAGNGAGDGDGTRLLFGSAIVPVARTGSAHRSSGAVFRSLLRFHKLYSHLLLRAAKSRLERR